MRTRDLIHSDKAAWTTILRRKPENRDVVVVDIQTIPLNDHLTRYALTLANHSDPITFIGKRTTLTEARFYRDLSPKLEFLTPYCWFSDCNTQSGWVLLDDIPNHRSSHQWQEGDLERVANCLAMFHATFWNRPTKLKRYRWLNWYLDPVRAEDSLAFSQGVSAMSEQAWGSAGTLTPTFLQIANSVQTLQQQNWQTILQPEQMMAIVDLLDDPVPMLYPLRALPPTLIHGNPSITHWHLTLFGDGNLLDWKNVAIGPSLCDLVTFMEQVEYYQTMWHGQQSPENWTLRQEMIIDTYILRLHTHLWPLFDARTLRKTLPAATCLYVLTQWVSRLAEWLRSPQTTLTTPPTDPRIDNEQPHLTAVPEAERLQPYLVDLFSRFWNSYKLL